jgi:hypothetical protein
VKSSPAKSAPVKPAKAAAVESAAAVRCGVGELWLRERSGEQQCSCDAYQSLSYPGLGSILG